MRVIKIYFCPSRRVILRSLCAHILAFQELPRGLCERKSGRRWTRKSRLLNSTECLSEMSLCSPWGPKASDPIPSISRSRGRDGCVHASLWQCLCWQTAPQLHLFPLCLTLTTPTFAPALPSDSSKRTLVSPLELPGYFRIITHKCNSKNDYNLCKVMIKSILNASFKWVSQGLKGEFYGLMTL